MAISVRSVRSPETELISFNSRKALKPASVQKLVTAHTVFKRFGPDHRFETRFYLQREEGQFPSLLVISEGDPSIRTEELLLIAQMLSRKLPGQRFAKIKIGALYDWGDFGRSGQRAYQAGYAPTSLNFNTVEFEVCPSSLVSRKAQVVFAPLGAPIQTRGAVVTNSSRRATYRIDEVQPWLYQLRGTVPFSSACETIYRSVANAPEYFGFALMHALTSLGLDFESKQPLVVGRAKPSGELVHTHFSKSLSLIVRDMNQYSSNFIAGQLVRILGSSPEQAGGPFELGIENLALSLRGLNIPEGEFVVRDGSGLSHENRLSAQAVTSLLSSQWSDFSIAPEFLSSLASPSRRGTLRKRDYGVFVRAKTGTLNGVRSLAGYVAGSGEAMYAFCILQNGSKLVPSAVQRERKLLQFLQKS